MELERLVAALAPEAVLGSPDPVEVRDLAYDARAVTPGAAFFAVPGERADGHDFAAEAVENGATVLVVERAVEPEVPQLVVPSTRAAMATAADVFFGEPTRELEVAGVTGTSGKTTTAFLLSSVLEASGRSPGLLGTVESRVGGEVRPVVRTTPEAIDLQRTFREMLDAGDAACVIEVSSHALELHRTDAIAFDCAVFTNLTQDHLDFHGTFDEYRRAKRRLFELLAASPKPGRTAVVNADDPAGAAMVAGLDVPVLPFGLAAGARVRAVEYTSALDGIRMTVDTPRGRLTLRSALIGEHNVMNLLGAVATGLALGLAPDVIARALAGVSAVPGRFEQVRAGQPFLVVVDYAHTPDALERVLTTARKITRGRLGVVFGCGGDRDRGKRPIMGEIAARLADRVWVTSDNPRSEAPEAIIDEVVVGVERVAGGGERSVREADRRLAIHAAVGWAGADDTVVIAGKGHETYQIIGGRTLDFDDRAVAREALGEERRR